ncbi:MAG: thioesterase [Bacteroidota bacterium]|nr:thioesterase [Bacteroidota bacterium]
MQNIWEEKVKVRALDVDTYNRFKLSSVFSYLTDISAAAAENINVGFHHLRDNNLFWALSWVKVKILNYPKYEDEIKIKTWHKGYNRLFAMRDLLFFDNSNNAFCKVTTAWLIVQLDNRKILPPAYLDIPAESQNKEDALTELPRKMPAGMDMKNVYNRAIRFSDVDFNKHVNNATYINFILDAYPHTFFEKNNIKTFEISFNSEISAGDEIVIRSNYPGNENSSLHNVDAININNNKQVFNSIIEWRPV